MHTLPDHTDLLDLTNALKNIAASAYEFKNGFYDLVDDSHYAMPQTLDKICKTVQLDDYPSNNEFKALVYDVLKQAQAKFGFLTFQHYAYGNTALVLKAQNDKGRHLAIRVGYNDYSNKRPTLPHVIQPYDVFSNKFFKIEVLPLVHVLDTRKVNPFIDITPSGLNDRHIRTLDDAILYLLDRTCFSENHFTKDLAVLPDGTAINVDPGAIGYRSINDLAASFLLIKNRIQAANLLAVFNPWTETGELKQNVFFPPAHQSLLPRPLPGLLSP